MNRKRHACTMIVSSLLILNYLSAFNGLGDGGAYPFDPTELGATFAGGSGTISDPYQISNVYELQNMSLDLNAHYVLVSDINASATVYWNSGAGFKSIGGSVGQFKGSLDGRNYTITRLFINRPSTDFVGLLGYLGPGGSIMNVGLVDSNITASSDVGGLAGIDRGIISNSGIVLVCMT